MWKDTQWIGKTKRRVLLTKLRGYADMLHCNCAGSKFISFCIVGSAIGTDVVFAH